MIMNKIFITFFRAFFIYKKDFTMTCFSIVVEAFAKSLSIYFDYWYICMVHIHLGK